MLATLVESLKAKGCILEEAKVFSKSGLDYWHAAILDSTRYPVSGGFSQDRMQARKVAIAEFLERQTYRDIARGPEDEKKQWGLDIIPTACGFAAGFDRANTILRSINEAVERWVMSKWIDDHYYIEELDPQSVKEKLDPMSQYFVEQFDEVRFFKKDVAVPVGSGFIKVEVGQTMALLGDGIFPGSSAQYTDGSLWQHSLLESYRHLLAVRNNPRTEKFPGNKVRYFAENAKVALKQIEAAQRADWPLPTICLHRCQSYLDGQYFVARTIIGGWRSWHEGPIERFLY